MAGLNIIFAVVLLCFPPVGGTWCETAFFIRTISDLWLIDSDPVRFIPMMMARMIISLKEVASSRQPCLDLEVPSELLANLQDTHSPHTMDGIPLPVLESGQV